jgi:hypothetical protein
MTEANGDREDRASQLAAGLQARLDYAKALSDWADQFPQPTTTIAAERSFPEMLGELCAKLAKIISCGRLQDIVNQATDAMLQGEGNEYLLEQIKKNAQDEMKDRGCSSL